MTIWDTLLAAVDRAGRQTFGAIFDALAAQKARRDEAAFSIALIALSAKMAKADGVVTDDEIAAFRRFFAYPDDEAKKVETIYRLAQQDVAGFEHYVSKVARLFAGAPAMLEDVLDCLYYIASADGVEHPRERELLEKAAERFGLPKSAFWRIRMVHFGRGEEDPFAILGVDPDADASALKAAYRKLVREHHPDALIGRGVPAALAKIAEARMATINDAYRKALAQVQ